MLIVCIIQVLSSNGRHQEKTAMVEFHCMKLQGIFPPIATPFDHEGNFYPAKLRHNIEKWNLTTLSGYVVTGSTGESVMLTPEEKFTVWEEAAKWAGAEKLMIAGTGV